MNNVKKLNLIVIRIQKAFKWGKKKINVFLFV